MRRPPTFVLDHGAFGNARPDLIDRIVYVSAWAPVDLDVGDYYAEPEMASVDAGALAGALAADPAALGLLRCNFRTADPGVLASVKEAFLADGTDDEFFTFLNTFQPDENPYDVHALASSHLMWLVRPRPAAELLAGLASSKVPAEG